MRTREGGRAEAEGGGASSRSQKSIGYRLVGHASGLWRQTAGRATLGCGARGSACGKREVSEAGWQVAGSRPLPEIRRRRIAPSVACLSLRAGGRGLAGLGLCREMGQWSMWPQGRVAAWGGLQGTGLAVCPRLVCSGFWTSRGLGLPR